MIPHSVFFYPKAVSLSLHGVCLCVNLHPLCVKAHFGEEPAAGRRLCRVKDTMCRTPEDWGSAFTIKGMLNKVWTHFRQQKHIYIFYQVHNFMCQTGLCMCWCPCV